MEKMIVEFCEAAIGACDLDETVQIKELSELALASVGGGIGDTTL